MIQITMPRLSDTMEEGVISAWLKQPGDTVEAGEPIAEIETDKALMEYEAYDSGILARILVEAGETAAIGAPIAELDDGKGPASAGTAAVSAPATAELASQNGAVSSAPAPAAPAAATARGAAGRPPSSPLVRSLAREHGLDLSTVTGSGPGGRIIRADVERMLKAAPASAAAAPAAAPAPAAPAPVTTAPAAKPAPATPGGTSADDHRDSEEVPLSSVRRVIARRLSESARTVPHFYVTAVADAEALVTLRQELNATLAAAGRPKVSINDLVVRAAALALREHPLVNASYRGDEETTMLVHRRVNVGIAVASDNGLVVPVIDDADRKTVTQIGAESRQLAALAGERRLSPAQMSGGTFTVSNLGMFGVEEFTAIINPPEGAILAVGATAREPVAVGDEVQVRHRMRYTLSSDHRIIDGALAAQFLQTLTRLIENPWTIVV